MKFLLVLFIFSNLGYSQTFMSYGVDLNYGTANMQQKSENESYGNKIGFDVDLYAEYDNGLSLSFGKIETETDGEVSIDENVQYNSTYISVGGFHTLYDLLKFSMGAVYFKTDKNDRRINRQKEYDLLGGYASLGITQNLNNITYGLDYLYQQAGNIRHSGAFFNIGFIFK